MKISFCPMEEDHLDGVMEIEKLSFSSPWSRNSFYKEITDNDFAIYLVALDGDSVVGYGGVWIILDEAHITTLAVHPDYRGKKIGESLLRHLIGLATLKGVKIMFLEVRVSNIAAQNLYTKLGFVPKAVRKGYYSDNREDAIIMWKEKISEEI